MTDNQARRIIDYVGSTKVATVDSNWGTNPSSATTYEIQVENKVDVAMWAGAKVVDVTTAGVPHINLAEWLGSAPDSLSSGKIPADLKLWLATAPLALTSQLVQSQVNQLGATAKTDVNAEVDGALDTAIPVSPTADSVNERLKRLEEDVTTARAGNLDNLDAAVTTRATPAQVGTELDNRNLNDLVQITGSVSDSTPAAGNFDGNAGLSATDDFYNGMVLVFTAGTLAGISRRINDYNGTTKNIVLENSFPVAPADTDAFSIVGIEVMPAAPAGTTDWTSGEKENIRDALGVTGTKTAASGGQLQAVKSETDKITITDAGAGVAGSVIEEIENRSTPADSQNLNMSQATPGTPTADTVGEALRFAHQGIPNAGPGTNGGLGTVDANNRIAGIQGTKNTLDQLNDFDSASQNVTVGAVVTDAINAASLAADAANEIADALLKRDIDQVEASAALHSLGTAVLKSVSRIRNNAGTLEVFRTDGITVHMKQTVTTDAANEPVDELAAGISGP